MRAAVSQGSAIAGARRIVAVDRNAKELALASEPGATDTVEVRDHSSSPPVIRCWLDR